MAAFQRHCSFGFWKGALIFAPERAGQSEAMGQFGRIARVSDLPNEKRLIAYVRKAAKMNEDGVKESRLTNATARRVFEVPADFHRSPAKERSSAQDV